MESVAILSAESLDGLLALVGGATDGRPKAFPEYTAAIQKGGDSLSVPWHLRVAAVARTENNLAARGRMLDHLMAHPHTDAFAALAWRAAVQAVVQGRATGRMQLGHDPAPDRAAQEQEREA